MSIIVKDICRGVTEKRLTITNDDIEIISTFRGDMLALHQDRWALEALIDSHGFPKKDIQFLAFPILCHTLFNFIKENFSIPLDKTAKIISIHTDAAMILPHLSRYRLKNWPEKLVLVRIEANATFCERKHDKCMRCKGRYRCITQRKE